jgi:hypothetical protein
MLDKSAFSEAIDYVLQDEGRITAALVPGVFQPGAGDQPLAARYRTRHQIEAVRRIWATADTHAIALVTMLREDYDAARLWAEYIAAEINLDKLNLEEVAQYGVDEARVRATPPLRSTVGMIEVMMRNTCAIGSLPSVAYAVIVEWNWARTSVVSAERAREVQGLEFIKAVAAHPEFDSRRNHSNQVVEIAHRLASRRPDGIPVFLTLLRHTSAFFRAYFGELYLFGGAETPVRQAEPPPAKPAKGG